MVFMGTHYTLHRDSPRPEALGPVRPGHGPRAGPGLLLVPLLPEVVLGMPRLYAWLVAWFGVEVLLVTAAILADPPARDPS